MQVKELVSSELFAKYDKLLLQTGLDTMLDIVYCPRPSCQQPVILDRESSMGSCPSCSFVFCALCKLGYHGVSPCTIKAGLYIILMYRSCKLGYHGVSPCTIKAGLYIILMYRSCKLGYHGVSPCTIKAGLYIILMYRSCQFTNHLV